MDFKINYNEVLSYLGFKGKLPPDDIKKLIEKNISECETAACPKSVYGVFGLDRRGEDIALSGTELILKGSAIRKRLEGCAKAIVFAVTIGADFERILKKKTLTAPHEGLIFDACGSAAAEALAEAFEIDARSSFGEISQRFSPGYADLPLDVQPEIIRLLDCPKKIGLCVLESHLLTPTKSVTAIIGIKEKQYGKDNHS